jgi:hypothetical protein
MDDEKQIRWVVALIEKKTQLTSKQDTAIAVARYRAVVNVRKEKNEDRHQNPPYKKPDANLFLELGFTPDEAKRLQLRSADQ